MVDLNDRMGTSTYPIESFRSNVVVSSEAMGAWEEEDWLEFQVGELQFRKLKECARYGHRFVMLRAWPPRCHFVSFQFVVCVCFVSYLHLLAFYPPCAPSIL
jgi:hypothetical protein